MFDLRPMKLVDEYISLRPVLLRLVSDPMFDGLYKTKKEAERKKRNDSFVASVRSEDVAI